MNTVVSTVLIAAPLAFLVGWIVSKAILRQYADSEPATAPTPETTRDFDPNATIQRPDGRTLLAQALEENEQRNAVNSTDATPDNATENERQLAGEQTLLKEALAERDHVISELKARIQDLPDLEQLPGLNQSGTEDALKLKELAEQLESNKHESLLLSGQLHKAEALADQKLRHMVTWRNRAKPLVKQCRQQRRIINELRDQLRNGINADKPGITVEIPADDLQVLRGIGPALEKRLNSQGIYCYRQIAAMTEADLVELGQSLGIGKNRTLSAEWLAQARDITNSDVAEPATNAAATEATATS